VSIDGLLHFNYVLQLDEQLPLAILNSKTTTDDVIVCFVDRTVTICEVCSARGRMLER
jgi:hypothetical protein